MGGQEWRGRGESGRGDLVGDTSPWIQGAAVTTITFPFGRTIELRHTSTGLPPNEPSGISLNASDLWARLTYPGWDSGWHRVGVTRSIRETREWFDLVETPADLRVAWCETVGGVWPPPRYDETWAKGVDRLTNITRY